MCPTSFWRPHLPIHSLSSASRSFREFRLALPCRRCPSCDFHHVALCAQLCGCILQTWPIHSHLSLDPLNLLVINKNMYRCKYRDISWYCRCCRLCRYQLQEWRGNTWKRKLYFALDFYAVGTNLWPLKQRNVGSNRPVFEIYVRNYVWHLPRVRRRRTCEM